jgi:hypothetical protein
MQAQRPAGNRIAAIQGRTTFTTLKKYGMFSGKAREKWCNLRRKRAIMS